MIAKQEVHDSVVEPARPVTKSDRILKMQIEFIPSTEFEPMLVAKARLNVLEAVPLNGSVVRKDAASDESLKCLAPALGESLLSFAEEQHEFRRMNFLKFSAQRLQSTLDQSNPDARTVAEIERLLAEAQQTRDHLIRANMRLVVANAGKYCTTSYSFEDLVSDGTLALMEAVEKFDYQRGFRFSTYATHAIRRSFFRKIGRRQKDRTRFTVTDPEVLTSAVDHREVDFDAPNETQLINHMLLVLSDHLTERELRVIEGRFGLKNEAEPRTLMELSSELGICKERVRQIEGIALGKLRTFALKYSAKLA